MWRELKKPPLRGSMGKGVIPSTPITHLPNPPRGGSRELIHTDAPVDFVFLLAAKPLHPTGQMVSPR